MSNTQRLEGHTPTPWTLDADRDRVIAPRPESEDNWIICEMGGSCENPSVLADASFIVHAVNNIERLEKVNEALVKYAEKRLEVLMAIEVPSMAELDEHIEIREMLALAKEPA